MLKSMIRPVWRSIVQPTMDRAMGIPGWRARVESLVHRSRFLDWTASHRPPMRISGSYDQRFKLHEHVFERENLGEPILYLEFGVFRGESLRWWLNHNRHPDSRFVGFDSFRGLPEDWRNGREKGTFSTDGQAPAISDPRCRFEIGWFNETVVPFVQSFEFGKRMVVHLDADLYSSTLLVLFALAQQLKPQDVILFDEFRDLCHEFRAFIDFTTAYPRQYDVVGVVGDYGKVAIKLLT